jgi:hypothetical protein
MNQETDSSVPEYAVRISAEKVFLEGDLKIPDGADPDPSDRRRL